MVELILAVLCSVSVGVLIKIARAKGIFIAQSIAVNYVVASAMCYFLLKPDFKGQTIVEIVSNHSSAYLFFSLGILLPFVFLMQAKAIELAGIVRTDAVQRLSLFLPIMAAFLIFGEAVTFHKLFALILAFIALGGLLWKPSQTSQQTSKTALMSLVLVWLGFGVIDILFKQMAKTGSSFPVTLLITFIGAGCMMFIYLLLKRTQWHIPSVLTGLLLGVLNFCNILFYLKAHQAMKDDPTLVFTGMNLGVICGGALIGVVVFKEKMYKLNYAGVALAIMAILILFYGR